jgi:tetratricopeptide (TPR) repeat protein
VCKPAERLIFFLSGDLSPDPDFFLLNDEAQTFIAFSIMIKQKTIPTIRSTPTKLLCVGLLLTTILLISCASRGFYSTSRHYPWGVDSTVVNVALGEASTLFVPIEREEKALEAKEKGIHQFHAFLKLDSLTVQLDATQDVSQLTNRIQNLGIDGKLRDELLKTMESSGIERVFKIASEEKWKLLIQAFEHFQDAYGQNPFDIDLLIYLGRTYTQMGQRNEQIDEDGDAYFVKASDVLNRALNMDRGGHDIYYNLALNYRAAGDLEKSIDYFQRAFTTMNDFAFLPRDPFSESFDAHADSALFYKYMYLIGDTYAKLYDAQQALRALEDAKVFAVSDENTRRLEEYIRWIQWASGHIAARETFEQGMRFEEQGAYTQAAEKYHEVMAETRHTAKRAYWETAWRLSKVEMAVLMADSAYAESSRTERTGIDRLRDVVHEIPKDSLGIPLDTAFTVYFDDFATMLYNEAEKALTEQGDRRQAEDLFAECANLHSNIQAKGCLRMTTIYQNARFIGLYWALRTYHLRKQLDREEISTLHVLFRRVTRRSNHHVLMKYFNEQFRYILEGIAPSLDTHTELMAYEFLRSGYHHLNVYLWENYRIRGSSEPEKRYEKMYRVLEKRLPPEQRKSIRDEITKFYYQQYKRPEDRHVFEEWQTYSRTL